ncbi:MAG: hypothetical protein A2145_02595 [candidate division Zixibacteria bacterium RBG_16_40_9]|nr:MAG: hypothetical protein A2145_02595 [candidate division Zixibacteria bacterium RBG_16_40_9]
MLKEEDQILVQKALKGEQKAYHTLLARHKKAVFHIIYKIVSDQEEALDLVQETFMKAFVSLSSYNPQYRFSTWLYKIAANCAIDYLRKKKRDTISLDAPIKIQDEEIEVEVPDWSKNPEAEWVAKQKALSIAEAIQSLPKQFREVILYRHRDDKSYDEIAEILKIPVGTVKARIFRARELLKKKLKSLREGF